MAGPAGRFGPSGQITVAALLAWRVPRGQAPPSSAIRAELRSPASEPRHATRLEVEIERSDAAYDAPGSVRGLLCSAMTTA